MCGGVHVPWYPVEVREQSIYRISSLLSPHVSLGSNLGYQVWWQGPFQAEQSWRTYLYFYYRQSDSLETKACIVILICIYLHISEAEHFTCFFNCLTLCLYFPTLFSVLNTYKHSFNWEHHAQGSVSWDFEFKNLEPLLPGYLWCVVAVVVVLAVICWHRFLSIAQFGLEILLPQHLECLDFRHVPLYPSGQVYLDDFFSFLVFSKLKIEPKALCRPRKPSTTELCP